MAGENFNEPGDLRSIRESVAALAAGAPASAGATEAKQNDQITAEQAIQATLGATNGTAVVTDANGTLQQYLRGLVKFFANALGAGTAASANRVTLASDDPLVAKFVGPFPAVATPWTYAAAASGIVNTTTAVTFKAADGSLRNYISAMQIMWEALGTATELAIRDGAAGTVLWRMKIPASLAGAREVIFPVPLRSTAATLLEIVTLTASTTGAVYFDSQGFVAA